MREGEVGEVGIFGCGREVGGKGHSSSSSLPAYCIKDSMVVYNQPRFVSL